MRAGSGKSPRAAAVDILLERARDLAVPIEWRQRLIRAALYLLRVETSEAI
jgi:hypothetical protein